jgi:hypothetical protein
MTFERIPADLRAFAQWINADYDKRPLNPRDGSLASPTDPTTWSTFDDALANVVHGNAPYLGFVLAETDPFAIIDLDNKPEKPCPPELWAQYEQMVAAFDSYAERSAGGRGYHLVVRAKVPGRGGTRKDQFHIEMYSTARYMICTGDVVRDLPIIEKQAWVENTYRQLNPVEHEIELDDRDELMSDRDVVEMAQSAVNGDKYLGLANGQWQALGYPSQSEADFALMSMLAFYTPSNEQAIRLFRYSGLGKRDKALRDEYVKGMLRKIRATQPPPLDLEQLGKVVSNMRASAGITGADVTQGERVPGQPAPVSPANEAIVATGMNGSAIVEDAQGNVREVNVADLPTLPDLDPLNEIPAFKDFPLPPGVVGEMAAYFYASSVRPVPEIAVSAAIAMTAGIVGRAFNISNTGLNQYLILIARTGSGKEGAASAIERLVAAARSKVPMIDEFIGPSAFASGQALIRRLDKQPSFVSVLGEFGLTLQQICSPQASSSQIMLRKCLLDLYAKSGKDATLRETTYSDTEKNTKMVKSPNVTLLGETTPETFFEGLSSSHISEGLIPRFLVVQYDGPRPPTNEQAGFGPPPGLLGRFIDLVVLALTAQNQNVYADVKIDDEAKVLLAQFDKRSDAEINRADQDVEHQLWNRAHLKALKLAGVLAVGCNAYSPVVTVDIARWALDFVKRDIGTVLKRFKSGDVGQGDSKLGADLRRLIDTYLVQQSPRTVDRKIHAAGIIPLNYLIQRTHNLSAFKQDRRGAHRALKETIATMQEGGLLVELTPADLFQRFSYRGRCWMVTNEWRRV